jgi:NAD-dependent deacetylase
MDELVATLRAARHVAVMTGAGASAESGIPTFRDAMSGLWSRFDALELATPEAFARDPALVWGWYEWRRMMALRAQPNAGHRAIAAMAAKVPRFTLITQNVDDLHERAGHDAVLHLHGSLHRPRCSVCALPHVSPPEIPAEPRNGRRLAPPACHRCGGPVRSGVVWFGEILPERTLRAAQLAAGECDVFFSVGTSSQVYPAAQLPQIAQHAGAVVVQVNPDRTALDDSARHNLRGQAGEILPRLVRAAWGDEATAAAS